MLPKTNKSALYKKMERFTDIRAVGLIAFGVVVILVAWSSLRALQINYELQKQEASLNQQNQIKKLENENLRLKNVYLESEEYLELSARSQFNKAAPGEKLYIVPESVAAAQTVDLPKTDAQIAEEKQQNKPKYQQNIQAWRNFFFHINE